MRRWCLVWVALLKDSSVTGYTGTRPLDIQVFQVHDECASQSAMQNDRSSIYVEELQKCRIVQTRFASPMCGGYRSKEEPGHGICRLGTTSDRLPRQVSHLLGIETRTRQLFDPSDYIR